jgi:hypothetical protein
VRRGRRRRQRLADVAARRDWASRFAPNRSSAPGARQAISAMGLDGILYLIGVRDRRRARRRVRGGCLVHAASS